MDDPLGCHLDVEICTIIIPTHSKHEKFIREKLDAHDPDNMKPFFIYPEFSGFTIAFIGDHCDPKVVAEIKVERGINNLFALKK